MKKLHSAPKKIVTAALVLAMLVSSFSGCAKGDDNSKSAKESDTSKSAVSSDVDSSTVSTEDTGTDGKVNPCRIVQPGVLSAEYEKGMAAVNEQLLADGVDIEVEVTRIPWDAYSEKLNLMLTTGEEFELLHIMQDVKNLSSIAGMGAITPLEDLLDKYPNLVSKFTDLEWKGTVYNGERFAVPCSWRSFDNTMSNINLRGDVMKAVGYEEFPEDSVENLIDLMKKSQDYILEETGVKAYNWYHQNQDTAHWLHRSYDTYPFYVENSLGLIISRQDGTIDSFYESEEFKQDSAVYKEMYDAGLINPDILNLESQVKYDQADLGAFLPSQTFDPYYSVTIKNTTGIESEVIERHMAVEKPDMVYTYVQNLNAISSTSSDPESGLKFLDWLYDSRENHDTFHYGIEGEQVTFEGDDRMTQIKGDDDQALYNMDTWMTGYMPYMRYKSDAPDTHIDFMTYRSENYVVSPVAGFIFDTSNVTTELTNLQTEIIASIYPIKVGMLDYDSNIGPAIEKLKAAGLDEYLEEYRTQFKAYLDANPDTLELAKGTTK